MLTLGRRTEGARFHQGRQRAKRAMLSVLGEWEKVLMTEMGITCHPVHHKHPACGCPHSHLHMLLWHQSAQPASGMAARATELPVLAWAGARVCGTSSQDYLLHFGWTCWLEDAAHCHSGSPMSFAMERAGDWAWPCILVLAIFWVPCAAACLAPSWWSGSRQSPGSQPCTRRGQATWPQTLTYSPRGTV